MSNEKHPSHNDGELLAAYWKGHNENPAWNAHTFGLRAVYDLAATPASNPAAKCDGNHGMPRCDSAQCWHDDLSVLRAAANNLAGEAPEWVVDALKKMDEANDLVNWCAANMGSSERYERGAKAFWHVCHMLAAVRAVEPAGISDEWLGHIAAIRETIDRLRAGLAFTGVLFDCANNGMGALDKLASMLADSFPAGWIPATTLPQVEVGNALHCWLTVKNKRNGKLYVWDRHYCNFPVLEDDQGDVPDWTLCDTDGEYVEMVGWAEKSAHPDFSEFYTGFRSDDTHEIIAWQPVLKPQPATESEDKKGTE